MIIIITGTPGTGKTTVAKLLEKRLGIPVYDDKIAGKGSVDLRRLRMKAMAIVRREKDVIFEGHLYCEVKLPADRVFVLRTNPFALLKRLEERKWSRKKVMENVLAEALDYCLIKAEEKYGNVIQIDTTNKSPEETAELIMMGIAGEFQGESVNWSQELLKLIQKGFITGVP